MLKNKNEVTKISNIFFIAIGFMSFLSLMTLIFGGADRVDGFNKNDYNYNLIMMAIYTVLSVLTLYITNKKVNVYKDEYPPEGDQSCRESPANEPTLWVSSFLFLLC